MPDRSPLAPGARGVVLSSLLAQNPGALIVAISPVGFFIPMPPGVPCGEQRVIEGHSSALELVVADDAKLVIDTWVRAQEHGAAFCEVHLLVAPQEPVVLHFVDASDQHGCYIGLFLGVASHVQPKAEQAVIRPRYTVMHKNLRAFITWTDEAMTRVLGWTSDELCGNRSLEYMHPDDHPRAIANWMDMLAAPGEARRVRVRHLRKDRGWLWVEVTNYNYLGDPADPHVRCEIVDVSDEMAALEALRASEQTLRRLAEALPMGVLQIDRAGMVVYQNERTNQILGRRTGATLTERFSNVFERHQVACQAAVTRVLGEGSDVDLEVELVHRLGVVRCELRLRALTDAANEVTGAILCLSDITADARIRDELHQRATFDTLTGCHNRSSILAAVRSEIERTERRASREGLGVLFLDLDHFKEVNDDLGHAHGDIMLSAVASRLLQTVRVGDLVGRFGGDEFLVLCPGVASAPDALAIAGRLVAALGAPLMLGPRILRPSASVGVAWSNAPEIDPDQLIAQADLAMYQSKRARRGEPVLARGTSLAAPASSRST